MISSYGAKHANDNVFICVSVYMAMCLCMCVCVAMICVCDQVFKMSRIDIGAPRPYHGVAHRLFQRFDHFVVVPCCQLGSLGKIHQHLEVSSISKAMCKMVQFTSKLDANKQRFQVPGAPFPFRENTAFSVGLNDEPKQE